MTASGTRYQVHGLSELLADIPAERLPVLLRDIVATHALIHGLANLPVTPLSPWTWTDDDASTMHCAWLDADGRLIEALP